MKPSESPPNAGVDAMNPEVLLLRIVHIVGGVIWAGTALFVALFLLPAMNQAGPAGAPVMNALIKRRLFTIVPTVGAITMLAGLRLLWLVSSGFSADYFSTREGKAYAFGALCALTGFTIFMLVNRPAIARLVQLGPQMAQASETEREALTAQLNAVRARMATGTKVIAMLLGLAVLMMAIARYL
jgi:uncharacterized membrane protein